MLRWLIVAEVLKHLSIIPLSSDSDDLTRWLRQSAVAVDCVQFVQTTLHTTKILRLKTKVNLLTNLFIYISEPSAHFIHFYFRSCGKFVFCIMNRNIILLFTDVLKSCGIIIVII